MHQLLRLEPYIAASVWRLSYELGNRGIVHRLKGRAIDIYFFELPYQPCVCPEKEFSRGKAADV